MKGRNSLGARHPPQPVFVDANKAAALSFRRNRSTKYHAQRKIPLRNNGQTKPSHKTVTGRLHSQETQTMDRMRKRSGSRPCRPFHVHLCPIPVIILGYLTCHLTQLSTAQETCDFASDTCPYKFDGECDDPEYCPGGDCFDCDPCSIHFLDCGACVAAGCFWCPFDGVCQSDSRGGQFWSQAPDKIPGCPSTSDWQQTCDSASPDNVFTDPLYDSMKWLFDMIKVEEVWRQGITGKGIHVRVNDVGVDGNHVEFAANFDVEHSCESYLPLNYTTDDHGTASASIIGAIQNNDACSVGVAPGVTISACNIGESVPSASELFMNSLEVVDIINNSWGPIPCSEIETRQQQDTLKQMACPFSPGHPESPCIDCGATFEQVLSGECESAIAKYCKSNYEDDPVACGEYLDIYVSCEFNTMSPTEEEGFARVIQESRGGKGAIITFAGGNDYSSGADANADGMVNSRYTIGVAAVGKDGLHASYSTTGAAILVAAPGGDTESFSNNIVALQGGGCHDVTFGTSFATPVVSAVAALMFEANSELGWRDVQAIIAKTSQKNDFDDDSWTTNAAGVSHSYKYGFGVIDAAAAVAASKTWENLEVEKQIMVESGTIDVAIPDITESQNGILEVLIITEAEVLSSTGENDIEMESVVVYLDVAHPSRGDLQIILTSPQGTQSILAPGKRPENTLSSTNMKLMSLRSWNESPVGTWTLEIADKKAGVIDECLDLSWQYSSEDTFFFGCSDIEDKFSGCTTADGVPQALIDADFNGVTTLDACCVCGGGQLAADIQPQLSSWRMITYGHKKQERTSSPTPMATLTPTPPAILPPIDSASCDFRAETCPIESLWDHECSEGCVDCFDCDRCKVHSATSCATCVQNDCVWCPGDATCLSVALDEQYWATFEGKKTSSCPETTDWTNFCETATTDIFPDPLYDSMAWSYTLINVEPVWREGITGAGVHVRVNDDGVDATHPEFSAKFDVQNSCTDYLPTNPEVDNHGTACASIIAGSTNDACAVGIAPSAVLSACKFPSDDDPREAEMFLTNLAAVDISSNSYGPDTCEYTTGGRKLQFRQTECPFPEDVSLSPCAVCGAFWGPSLPDECLSAVAEYCNIYFEESQAACIEYMDFFVSCAYHILPPVLQDAWTRTITEGRNGLGIIYVVSAGNLYTSRENTNANGYLNSRFTMAVAAVGKDGKHASYSSTGASVFISAPGGDIESVSNNIVAKPGGGCHDVTMGTSFAAPVVSGVVALMLEVNPNLGWRDVQGILAQTALQEDLSDDSWTTNSAGIRHSSKYGFGIVDASAAVTTARTWQRWGTEFSILGESGPVDTVIPDNELQQLQSTMTVEDNRNLSTESVVVFLDFTHGSSGDLEISLTGPGGTKSILTPGNRPETWQLEEEERWKFLTYSEWGTPPQGDWTLAVVDRSPGLISEEFAEVPNILKSWRMLIYVHDNDEVVTYPPTVTPLATSAPSIPTGESTPSTTISPGGVPVPTNPPAPLAPVPLSEAIVLTIPPNVTNLPFVTSGEQSGAAACRLSLWVSLSLSGLLLGTV